MKNLNIFFFVFISLFISIFIAIFNGRADLIFLLLPALTSMLLSDLSSSSTGE